MRLLSTAIVMMLAGAAHAAPLSPGTYTNEEEVYFDKEMKRPASALDRRCGRRRRQDRLLRCVWKTGCCTRLQDACRVGHHRSGQDDAGRRARDRAASGAPGDLLGAILKDAKKPDGSDDFFGKFGLKLHDQGGRVMFGGEAGVKAVVLRVRNVTWADSARSSNRPSLVLYIHTPDNPDHAVSYVWSDPGAARLGINLRWMQASCTVDGMERGATGQESRTN